MIERFIVDDCGTLIDMVTRDTYDYVSDVVTVCNALNDENNILKKEIEGFQGLLTKQDNVCYDRVLKIIDNKIRELKYGVNYGDIPLDLRLFCVTVLMDLKQEL